MSEVLEILGKTLVTITRGDDEINFVCSDGKVYKMWHEPDCCERVEIEDICGELENLIGYPLLMAEEATSDENPKGITPEYQDSLTWTFYKFATINGYVTIRWHGESNGCYSESVTFEEIEGGNKINE